MSIVYEHGDVKKWLETEKFSKIVVFSASNPLVQKIARELTSKLKLNQKIELLNDGENLKSIEGFLAVTNVLTKLDLKRNDIILAVGGGTVTDTVGFACASYMRGVRYISVPTTLLSMADAAVGGKVGINYNSIKNLLGAFHSPELLYVNSSYLKTLPMDEILSGYGELLKHSLLTSEEDFAYLVDSLVLQPEHLGEHVKRAIIFKSKIVEKDPFDQGIRQCLNAGHTFGHALESCQNSGNHKVPHGIAVILGLYLEGIAYAKSSKNDNVYCWLNMLENLIDTYGLKRYFAFTDSDVSRIIETIKKDKKNSEDKIIICAIKSPGEIVLNYSLECSLVKEVVIDFVNKIK